MLQIQLNASWLDKNLICQSIDFSNVMFG